MRKSLAHLPEYVQKLHEVTERICKEKTMLLLKDERKTLLKYYKNLQNTQQAKRFESLSAKVYIATHNLISRGLVHEIIEGGPEHVEYMTAYMVKDCIDLHNFLASSEDDIECDNITLRLTREGYDSARKYNSWWDRTDMWWAEYKGHWFFAIARIIVPFLLGLLTGKLT